ncbi:MAG: Fur family transcriptional regulator [Zhaonellaceae bacterium]|jgi:Fur family peroxide stress response transcriptional regulator|nr:transcriptional repressor [Clostridia bacterium]
MKLGSRTTKQKRVILEILQNTDTHPTADWVYQEARQILPDISLGTVYRNLNLLRDLGKIQELNYGSGQSRYDGNPVNHYHFVCEKCKKVLDLDLSVVVDLDEEIREKYGFQVFNHRLEFYGLCKTCQEDD